MYAKHSFKRLLELEVHILYSSIQSWNTGNVSQKILCTQQKLPVGIQVYMPFEFQVSSRIFIQILIHFLNVRYCVCQICIKFNMVPQIHTNYTGNFSYLYYVWSGDSSHYHSSEVGKCFPSDKKGNFTIQRRISGTERFLHRG